MPQTFDDLCSQHSRNREPGHRCTTCSRIRIERKIVRKCAQALLAAGYSVSVNDGEETTVTASRSLGVILAACFTTDQDCFLTIAPDGSNSFVQFIYGNSGWDVLSDYGTSLEDALKPVNDYADTLDVYA